MKVIPIQLTQVSQVRDFVNLTVKYPFDIELGFRAVYRRRQISAWNLQPGFKHPIEGRHLQR